MSRCRDITNFTTNKNQYYCILSFKTSSVAHYSCQHVWLDYKQIAICSRSSPTMYTPRLYHYGVIAHSHAQYHQDFIHSHLFKQKSVAIACVTGFYNILQSCVMDTFTFVNQDNKFTFMFVCLFVFTDLWILYDYTTKPHIKSLFSDNFYSALATALISTVLANMIAQHREMMWSTLWFIGFTRMIALSLAFGQILLKNHKLRDFFSYQDYQLLPRESLVRRPLFLFQPVRHFFGNYHLSLSYCTWDLVVEL